jgi:hypothetical protein
MYFQIQMLAKLHLYVLSNFVGIALISKNIVFRFIIEYGSLKDFGP